MDNAFILLIGITAMLVIFAIAGALIEVYERYTQNKFHKRVQDKVWKLEHYNRLGR